MNTVPNFSVRSVSQPILYRTFRYSRYRNQYYTGGSWFQNIGTGTGTRYQLKYSTEHFGTLGTEAITVPNFSVPSVLGKIPYREYRYHTELALATTLSRVAVNAVTTPTTTQDTLLDLIATFLLSLNVRWGGCLEQPAFRRTRLQYLWIPTHFSVHPVWCGSYDETVRLWAKDLLETLNDNALTV